MSKSKKILKKLLKAIMVVMLLLFVFLIVLFIYVSRVSVIDPPTPSDLSALQWECREVNDSIRQIEGNWFKYSKNFLHEMYVEGSSFERGVANGKLTKELVQYQEKVFNDQINRLVPSPFYRNGLKYFVGWFNRDLNDEVPTEFKEEIFGVSQSASTQYNNIALPYQRMLNYHAAHDIGHALQNMALVGCTSFATWGDKSVDSTLTIGRNFDFYVGDDFARHKIVAFVHPDDGIDFVMITFPGMIGVLSGMNVNGLTVTINAAKSEIPHSSATPVSLLAREVLQYASTIEEAKAIINRRRMFVAESFLIGSARDRMAAIVEKSPEGMDTFYTNDSTLICTNHFQSKMLGKTNLNLEHMKQSASGYRYKRVAELLENGKPNSILKTAAILRDRFGMGNTDIGLGNEKSINQLIAHHAVIFQPEKLKMWISTGPWQLGEFICYDLSQGIAEISPYHPLRIKDASIPADDFLKDPRLKDMMKFNQYRFPFNPRNDMNPDSLLKWNPYCYLSYMLAGDVYFDKKEFNKAKSNYEHAITLEIANESEKRYMEKKLIECNKVLQ